MSDVPLNRAQVVGVPQSQARVCGSDLRLSGGSRKQPLTLRSASELIQNVSHMSVRCALLCKGWVAGRYDANCHQKSQTSRESHDNLLLSVKLNSVRK
jgi:hypothetical protein